MAPTTPGKWVLSIAATAVAVVLLIGCRPRVPDEPAAAYELLCQRCHGADGRGPGKPEAPPKLDLSTSKSVIARDVAEVRRQIATGGEAMPAFGRKITATQLDMLARYTVDLVATAPGTAAIVPTAVSPAATDTGAAPIPVH